MMIELGPRCWYKVETRRSSHLTLHSPNVAHCAIITHRGTHLAVSACETTPRSSRGFCGTGVMGAPMAGFMLGRTTSQRPHGESWWATTAICFGSRTVKLA